MAKKRQKYYVVWNGVTPGIYHSWTNCQLQIKGYAGAKYKAFSSLEEANNAFKGEYSDHIGKAVKPKSSISQKERERIIWDSLSVDAACSGSPGIMEYRGVWTENKEEVFHQGPFPLATNNIGEFLALVHGIAYLKGIDKNETTIYTDSRTALSWLKKKTVKTTLVRNSKTENVHKLIERALSWLKNNDYSNPIVKWETEKWGEIPADFGRK